MALSNLLAYIDNLVPIVANNYSYKLEFGYFGL